MAESLLEFPLLAKHTGLRLGAPSGFVELRGERSPKANDEHNTAVPAIYLPSSHPTSPSYTQRQTPLSLCSNSQGFTKIITREAPAPHQAEQKVGFESPFFYQAPQLLFAYSQETPDQNFDQKFCNQKLFSFPISFSPVHLWFGRCMSGRGTKTPSSILTESRQ